MPSRDDGSPTTAARSTPSPSLHGRAMERPGSAVAAERVRATSPPWRRCWLRGRRLASVPVYAASRSSSTSSGASPARGRTRSRQPTTRSRILDQVATTQPPRLLGESDEPLEADRGHPAGRLAIHASEDIECRSHTDEHDARQVRAMAGHPDPPASGRRAPRTRSGRPIDGDARLPRDPPPRRTRNPSTGRSVDDRRSRRTSRGACGARAFGNAGTGAEQGRPRVPTNSEAGDRGNE